RLSQNEGQLSFTLAAPRLDQLGPQFGGALDASGTARGSFTRPQISANWSGSAVRLAGLARVDSLQGKADVQVDRSTPLFFTAASVEATLKQLRIGPAAQATQEVAGLSARVRFAPQPDAPLAMTVDAQGVRAGGLRATTVKLTASGTTARHEIAMTLAEPEQNWSLAADGGLQSLEQAPQWQGDIRRLDAAGRFRARLAAPAQLFVSREKVQLDRFRLDSPMAQLTVERFLRDERGIVTRGSMERLQVGQLMTFGDGEPALSTDLQLSGDWDVSLTDTPAGSVRIRRDGGDVTMRGGRPVALGLRSLEASANISGGELALRLRAQGEKLGLVDAAGKIGLAGGSRFMPASDAPVTAQVRIDIPSLGWAGPLVSPTSIVEGRLQSAVAVAGTLAQPRLSGTISGSGLRFLSADTGIDLRQGVLDAEFEESKLVLRTLRFPSREGQLSAAGTVDFAGGKPDAALRVKAERFQLLDRSDRRVSVSGESRIGWRDGRADIVGEFKADSGFFDIGSTSMPRLSDDVVVVGQTQKKPGERGLPASIDVGIDLGKGIALRGRGLDAFLAGQIRLASQPGEPLRARGTLRIEQGTFSAYGRELKIEQGVLRFNGPIDNPSLDIIAMRRGQQVEAGVTVLGTVLSPRIGLVSEPPVSEAEKLSWLVLGHGLESVGQGELGTLQSAAGALLSKGASAGVQSQIANALGLDQLSVGTTQDSLQQRIVTLGKQVSSRLFVSLERGLETASSVLHLRYTLSPKLTVEAEAGTRSALSLFYNISYD
ncbi:MAG: hypothetical protein JWQ00_2672, partial [Noviherbaspirillum sp.]|nr:hypothetical protein [Noviherbaspirillum sp.]